MTPERIIKALEALTRDAEVTMRLEHVGNSGGEYYAELSRLRDGVPMSARQWTTGKGATAVEALAAALAEMESLRHPEGK